MKKIIANLLLLIFIASPCLAAQDEVNINIQNVPLKSKLNTRYSAYKIEFTNTSINPIKILEIKCYNKISMADTSTMNNYNVKKTAICSVLAIPTLGISLLFLIPDEVKMTNNMYSTMNEASRYTPVNKAVYNLQNGVVLNVNNEILEQGQNVRYDILVPLNETPQINAKFQNLKDNKFITIEK